MLKKMKLGKLEMLAVGVLVGAQIYMSAPAHSQATDVNPLTEYVECAAVVAGGTFYVEVVDLFSMKRDDEIKLAYEKFKEGSDYEDHLENARISSDSINDSLDKLFYLLEKNPNCVGEFPQKYVDLLRESEKLNNSNDELYRGLLLLKDSKPS